MFIKFLKDTSGAIGIEYALIGTLVSLAIISGITSVGTQTAQSFDDVASQF